MPTKTATDQRAAVLEWERWGVENTLAIHYSEKADRIDWVGKRTGFLPIHPDCSSFQIMCAEWAGVPRPDGQPAGSTLVGDTLTLLAHCDLITLEEAQGGDLVLYGTDALSTQHVSCILGPGSNPMTVSHGREAGPLYQTVFADSRPKRYLRYLPIDPPTPPAPKEIDDMEFLAQSWNGPATLLYTVSTHSARGVSAVEAPFLKGKVTAYSATDASLAMRKEYSRVGLAEDEGFVLFSEFAPELAE